MAYQAQPEPSAHAGQKKKKKHIQLDFQETATMAKLLELAIK